VSIISKANIVFAYLSGKKVSDKTALKRKVVSWLHSLALNFRFQKSTSSGELGHCAMLLPMVAKFAVELTPIDWTGKENMEIDLPS